jgi:hypothetical protein
MGEGQGMRASKRRAAGRRTPRGKDSGAEGEAGDGNAEHVPKLAAGEAGMERLMGDGEKGSEANAVSSDTPSDFFVEGWGWGEARKRTKVLVRVAFVHCRLLCV